MSQPMPTGEGTEVTPPVIEDLRSRSDVGLSKYGTRLRAGNGRNALQDAYEEALDLSCCLKQRLIEELGSPAREAGLATADWLMSLPGARKSSSTDLIWLERGPQAIQFATWGEVFFAGAVLLHDWRKTPLAQVVALLQGLGILPMEVASEQV